MQVIGVERIHHVLDGIEGAAPPRALLPPEMIEFRIGEIRRQIGPIGRPVRQCHEDPAVFFPDPQGLGRKAQVARRLGKATRHCDARPVGGKAPPVIWTLERAFVHSPLGQGIIAVRAAIDQRAQTVRGAEKRDGSVAQLDLTHGPALHIA